MSWVKSSDKASSNNPPSNSRSLSHILLPWTDSRPYQRYQWDLRLRDSRSTRNIPGDFQGESTGRKTSSSPPLSFLLTIFDSYSIPPSTKRIEKSRAGRGMKEGRSRVGLADVRSSVAAQCSLDSMRSSLQFRPRRISIADRGAFCGQCIP